MDENGSTNIQDFFMTLPTEYELQKARSFNYFEFPKA